MKLCLLTIHVGTNFGSVLQTYATSHVLEQLGHEVDVLNYIPPRMTVQGFIKGRKGIIRKSVAMAGLPILWFNKQIYCGFLKRNVRLSKAYYDKKKAIRDIEDKYDVFITGSDQVWNSIHNQGIDDIYYWASLPKDKKRIAFSASFGRESLSEKEMSEIKDPLKNYSAISVRERSGIKILESMGINEVCQLPDPTFMLNGEQWRRLFIHTRLIDRPYLLMYTPYNIDDPKLLYDSARKIAHKKGLRIVSFGWDIRKDPQADMTRLFASPQDFLSLMYHADFVITNSFHGTAFSINLNKEFFVFQPSAFSTRIDSILQLTGLRHRLATGIPDDNCIENPIDFSPVNRILHQERLRAIDFLNDALKTI